MSSKKKYERPIVQKHYSGFMNKISSSPTTQIKSEIDGVSVNELVKKFGSPLFVISEKKIRHNMKNAYRIFKNRYPKVQFAWSYKTNYLNAVCSVFHSEGSWAEVVSGFEYEKARKLGIPGDKIIFNGPSKSKEELIRAVKEKAKIHIDHFDELFQLSEITESLNETAFVAIRVNMDIGIYPRWDRFGFNYENGEALQAIKRIMSFKNLELIGLHTHIGTYMMNAESYQIAASKLVALAKNIKDEFQKTIQYIDLGGGFASKNNLIGQYLPSENIIPSLEQYADAITTALFEFSNNRDELPMLILESGRSLIDDTASLISTVLANKRLSNGKRSIIIDAGVNILFTSFWYKHSIYPTANSGTSSEDSAIYGPLFMNIDLIRESIPLSPLKKGDKILIDTVGAYNMTQWMQFISMRPNVVMIMDDGTVELIRKAETLETLNNQELLPKKFQS